MVLNHVAGCADPVVVTGATTNPDIFGHSDLHVVNIIVVPEGFKHRVGESDRQNILNGLFSQIVVDAKNTARREDTVHQSIEPLSAFQIVTKGFFDNDPAPGIRCGAIRQSRTF